MATSESMAQRINRVRADLVDINNYYNISIAPRRHSTLLAYYSRETNALDRLDFDSLDQQGKVDFLILRNYLRRQEQQLGRELEWEEKFAVLLPFREITVRLLQRRQDVKPMIASDDAYALSIIATEVQETQRKVEDAEIVVDETTAYRASKVIEELRTHLREYFDFYTSYDPSFDWWVTSPWQAADDALAQYLVVVQTHLAGMRPGTEKDDIIGEPIGKTGLLEELQAEVIPYSPEELIEIAQREYAWCLGQMKKAAAALGVTEDWKEALEHVKGEYALPGEQTQLVRELAREGAAFVEQHDLVTVPRIAAATWRMFMMTPAQQRTAPFFLGGPSILVASPTMDMEHELKDMVLKSNNRYFSRATAFHELIPGHRLQLFMAERHNPHRSQLASTPFFVEGWALYWEMLFWERGDFFVSPEDKIGTLFWRMHRCVRIIFSLNFHLGLMTAEQCVDLLVDMVGHERSTAEAEVRRSFEGSYGPLYQAAYMIGALQLWALRGEVVDSGMLGEKEFHDAVLKTGCMPIELVRALILNKDLRPSYESQWKFYGEL